MKKIFKKDFFNSIDFTPLICYDKLSLIVARNAAYPLRGSKGFDRELEDGEASRRYALNPKLKLNAEDDLAFAA